MVLHGLGVFPMALNPWQNGRNVIASSDTTPCFSGDSYLEISGFYAKFSPAFSQILARKPSHPENGLIQRWWVTSAAFKSLTCEFV